MRYCEREPQERPRSETSGHPLCPLGLLCSGNSDAGRSRFLSCHISCNTRHKRPTRLGHVKKGGCPNQHLRGEVRVTREGYWYGSNVHSTGVLLFFSSILWQIFVVFFLLSLFTTLLVSRGRGGVGRKREASSVNVQKICDHRQENMKKEARKGKRKKKEQKSGRACIQACRLQIRQPGQPVFPASAFLVFLPNMSSNCCPIL